MRRGQGCKRGKLLAEVHLCERATRLLRCRQTIPANLIRVMTLLQFIVTLSTSMLNADDKDRSSVLVHEMLNRLGPLPELPRNADELAALLEGEDCGFGMSHRPHVASVFSVPLHACLCSYCLQIPLV